MRRTRPTSARWSKSRSRKVGKTTGVESVLNEASKEELGAHPAGQPTGAQVAAAMVELFISAVIDRASSAAVADKAPVDKICIDELHISVARALSMPQIRRADALHATNIIKSLEVDRAASGDFVAYRFPPASKVQGTNKHAIQNFSPHQLCCTTQDGSGHASIGKPGACL